MKVWSLNNICIIGGLIFMSAYFLPISWVVQYECIFDMTWNIGLLLFLIGDNSYMARLLSGFLLSRMLDEVTNDNQITVSDYIELVFITITSFFNIYKLIKKIYDRN